MGQKIALFYKYLLLTKNQKAGCLCQVISPLLTVLFYTAVLSTYDEIKNSDEVTEANLDSQLFQSNFYLSNMFTPKWEPLWRDLYRISTPLRLKRWSAASPELATKFESWIGIDSGLYTYYGDDENLKRIKYPLWSFSTNSSVEGLNEELIEDLLRLNKLARNRVRSNTFLPDTSTFVRNLDTKTGVDAHIQVNNIADPKYHRINGLTYGTPLLPRPSIGNVLNTPIFSSYFITEAGVGEINLFSNLHLQKLFQNDFYSIISTVSQTFDTNDIEAIVQSALAVVSAILFPVSMCLGFPIMLYVLVMEKEENIKALLETNGLRSINYWVSFFGYYFIILQITTVLWVMIGYFWIDFIYFNETSVLLNFWALTVWNLAQISFALSFSTFLRSAHMATVIGYQGSITFILFLCIVSQFLFPSPRALPIALYFFPQTGMVRFFYLAISKCLDEKCYGSLEDVKGEMLVAFISLHACLVFYSVLGLALNEPCLTSRFKCCFRFSRKRSADSEDDQNVAVVTKEASQPLLLRRGNQIDEEEEKGDRGEQTRNANTDQLGPFGRNTGDEDDQNDQENGFEVGMEELQEADKLQTDDLVEEFRRSSIIDPKKKHISAYDYEDRVKQTSPEDPEVILLAKKMSKSYPCSKGIKKALQKFSLKINNNQVFGLLGPNGAGKTTFLSIITGLIKPDGGQGWICGKEVGFSSSTANSIGFCPQFDILWPNLKAPEHFRFMSMFKGGSYSESFSVADKMIENVDLELDKHKRAFELSGGMKRRCSLGMALIGSPKIIFLDEPSSGLDPVKRRHFWELIRSVTKDRAVLLTTHLMEEAETLCDEIGIICTGKLRCVGNTLKLKKAFANGIKLQIMLKKGRRGDENAQKFAKMIVEKLGNGAKLESNLYGSLSFLVKQGAGGAKLSRVFEVIDEQEKSWISDWSVSLGSLEDVFLNVVRTFNENNIFPAKG